MKHLKKRQTVLIAIAALALVVLSLFLIFKGRTYEEEGLALNSRTFITNVRLEGDTVYCTFVNDTCLPVVIGVSPNVQVRVNGEWTACDIGGFVADLAIEVPPFSEREQSLHLNILVEDYAGEYRLFTGGAVGYLTITEEMAATLPDYKIHYTDGIRQSALLYADGVRFEQGDIYFTLHSELDNALELKPTSGVVQKKVDGEWQYYKLSDSKNEDGVLIEGGADESLHFSVNTSLTGIEGEYRLILCAYGYGPVVRTNTQTGERCLEFNESSTYVVGYFTITADMLN